MEVARRRGRRRKKLLDELKNRRGYSHLKEEALDHTMWRNRFGEGFRPVVRQNTEWMNIALGTMNIALGTMNISRNERSGVRIEAGAIYFIFSKTSTPVLGPTQPNFHWSQGSFLDVKRPGRDVNDYPPSSVEVKNGWSHACPHYTPS